MVNKTFDKISNEFSSTVNQTKEFIRVPLFLRLIGDIQNKSVADFGCGDGFFTRILMQNFPKKVVGVDYSEPMIKKAIEKKNISSQNINYLLRDIRQLELEEKFDLISAVYFLNYAESKEDLFKMIQIAFNHLKQNGKFCAIVSHPNIQPMEDFEYERKALSLDNKGKFEDGDVLRCEIKKENKYLKFNFYYWSKETYNELLQKIGFKNIEWVEPFVYKDGIRKFSNKYWDNFFKKPSSIGFICHK